MGAGGAAGSRARRRPAAGRRRPRHREDDAARRGCGPADPDRGRAGPGAAARRQPPGRGRAAGAADQAGARRRRRPHHPRAARPHRALLRLRRAAPARRPQRRPSAPAPRERGAGRRGAGPAGRRAPRLAGRHGARIGLAGAAAAGDRACRASPPSCANCCCGQPNAGSGRTSCRRWGSGTTCRSGSRPVASSAPTSRSCCCAGRWAGARRRSTAPALDAAELVGAALDALASDPELLTAERARVRHLLVDDAQDLDPQQMELVRVLGRTARTVVLAGDPDQAVLGFRGADPSGLDAVDAPLVVLGVDRRARPAVRAAAARLAARLPGTGPGRTRVGRRTNPPTSADGEVHVRVFGSAAQEAAWIADGLRRAHLQHGVPWSQMAVLSRSARRSLPVLRRALLAAGVPIAVPPDELPLARQPAVVPLLMVLRYAARPDDLDADAATALLTSPLGSADPLRLRRLRRGLLRLHAAGGQAGAGAPAAPRDARQRGSRGAGRPGSARHPSRHGALDDGGGRGAHRQRPAARGRAARRRPRAAGPAGRAPRRSRPHHCAGSGRCSTWRERPSARAPVPSRCCGGSGRPRTWSNGGSRPPRSAARWVRRRTATSTPSSRSSTAPPGTPTGCPARASPRSWSTSPTSSCRPTPSPPGRPTRTPSRCSPRTPRAAGSGGSWPCPASRRAPGRTCGCAAACWATSGWSTSSPGWPSPPPRCRGSRRCSPRSGGCSTSRARAPGRRCWSARCRRTAPR